MYEVIAVLKVHGVMAHRMQGDRLGKRLWIGHQHRKASGAEVVQYRASILLWRSAVNRPSVDSLFGKSAPQIANAAHKQAPHHNRAALSNNTFN